MVIVQNEIYFLQFTMAHLQFTMVIVKLKICYLQLIIDTKKNITCLLSKEIYFLKYHWRPLFHQKPLSQL